MYDCSTCGACCREAFDAVPVPPEDEATAVAQPHLVVDDGGWRVLRRVPSDLLPERTRCAALSGDGCAAPYRCTIYEDRPSACSGLDVGSEACDFARSRLGLTAGSSSP
jgi:Fe-S-cluster containining protein